MAIKGKIGERPRVTYTVKNYDGTALTIPPATFKVEVRKPDATVTTYTYPHASMTNPAIGQYVFTLPITFDQQGLWTIEGHSTGPDTVEADRILVGPQAIP